MSEAEATALIKEVPRILNTSAATLYLYKFVVCTSNSYLLEDW